LESEIEESSKRGPKSHFSKAGTAFNAKRQSVKKGTKMEVKNGTKFCPKIDQGSPKDHPRITQGSPKDHPKTGPGEGEVLKFPCFRKSNEQFLKF
jgi:hypothetical protein